MIGINVGIMMLMAGNTLAESVWRAMATAPEASRGMEAVGLAAV